ncbi:MAG: tetraacyldisaccharide 4'-kinase [Acidobacteriota bacterium]
MREPLAALRRADVVIVTRADQPYDHAALNALLKAHSFAGGAAYQSWLAKSPGCAVWMLTKRAHCRRWPNNPLPPFAALPTRTSFFTPSHALRRRLCVRRDFADHHAYTHTELADVVAAANRRAALLLTTKKTR